MKLKILTGLAGADFAHGPGDIVDQPDAAEARRWIAAGYAEAATADRAGVETASRKGRKPAPPAAAPQADAAPAEPDPAAAE